MKQRMQGMVVGFVIAALLMSSISVIAAVTQRIEVTYGINVVVNGVLQSFSDDMRPFVSGGRTFLSVRAIGEALGADVRWDGETSTVFVESMATVVPIPTPTPVPEPTPIPEQIPPERQPLITVAPHFDTGGGRGRNLGGETSVAALSRDSVVMSGFSYQNALRFRSNAWRGFGSTDGFTSNRFTLHNLNAQFTHLSGYIGRVDGTDMRNATIHFIGDGQLISSYELRATDMPIPISVPVGGVVQLRIEVVFPGVNNSGREVDYALIAYLE